MLDLQQRDEGARVEIDRLRLDRGSLGYDDEREKTHIRAELSSLDTQSSTGGVGFSARGQYKGLPITAHGSGGPVLALRDERTPYPLNLELSIGQTGVKAAGSITSLQKFSALDLRLDLRGRNLGELYPLLGVALPDTPPYVTSGHMVHSGRSWRYENFSGRIGHSDLAGTVQVETGGKRPAMQAQLVSRVLDLADLGPLIGAHASKGPHPAGSAPAAGHVLPDIPFTPGRWGSVDADVSLKAASIRRARQLPLEDFTTHLTLRDAVLKLDPLDFGIAGAHLAAVISLDGRQDPIQAHARVKVKKLRLSRLFPAFESGKAGIGEINGEFDLAGVGDSVGRMLASANGSVGLVVSDGRISRLMMEEVGLHLWEVLTLKVTGDKLVKLRCGVANFGVRQGVLRAEALVVDTEVTTLVVTGNINLASETLDLTLNQKTKITSPLALKSPIHVGGSLARPTVEVRKGPMLARGLGAIGLGIVYPLSALLPLIDAGPGHDSDCAQLVREASAPAAKNAH